ncbi:snRNA-activating protein complex subunit 3 [Drosophila novamexicana]|uniref:snRNA-activating protein complex subunit 3 n=1 Tax=Drosophila novamexicana TaxID=47314 RepID=UPI0011E5BC4D|nr:snRNA-activating protein complex subunit 3 [Drosophila novamexicana]
MENVLEPPQPSINLRQFLDEYSQKLANPAEKPLKNDPFYFVPKPPVSPDVAASCSLALLSAPDDNVVNPFEPGAEIQRPNVTKPQMDQYVPKTYTAINEHKAKSRRNPFTRTQYSHRLIAESSGNGDFSMLWTLEQFELELTVRFYRPPRAAHRGFKLERPVFAEEFICLGSNYLSELRDKISCICNGKRFVDISKEPEAPLPVLETNPGYFFINGTFYNDTRNPNNCDYSQTVLNWARTAQGVQDEEFTVASMETTRFIDLTVSLGAPMQYLHHGNCEHLFVFSQVEVLRPHSKYLDRSLYPFLRAFNTFNRRACYMCGLRGYHFIVEHSRRQLHDPSYLCRTCYYSFNYVNGQKVGQFKAYRIYAHMERPDEESECQPQEILDVNSSSEDSLDLDELS